MSQKGMSARCCLASGEVCGFRMLLSGTMGKLEAFPHARSLPNKYMFPHEQSARPQIARATMPNGQLRQQLAVQLQDASCDRQRRKTARPPHTVTFPTNSMLPAGRGMARSVEKTQVSAGDAYSLISVWLVWVGSSGQIDDDRNMLTLHWFGS